MWTRHVFVIKDNFYLKNCFFTKFYYFSEETCPPSVDCVFFVHVNNFTSVSITYEQLCVSRKRLATLNGCLRSNILSAGPPYLNLF